MLSTGPEGHHDHDHDDTHHHHHDDVHDHDTIMIMIMITDKHASKLKAQDRSDLEPQSVSEGLSTLILKQILRYVFSRGLDRPKCGVLMNTLLALGPLLEH